MDRPPHPIEAKVTVPSLVALAVAAIALASTFGLDLSDEQENAILGFVTAGLPIAVFVVGYLTKHTPRPDLLNPDQALTAEGKVTLTEPTHAHPAPGVYAPKHAAEGDQP